MFFGLFVEAASNRPVGHSARKRVGRERASVAAEHVARKLVEEDDESERALRVRFPCAQLAARCHLMDCQKPRPDNPVEILVLREVTFCSSIAPEGYDPG